MQACTVVVSAIHEGYTTYTVQIRAKMSGLFLLRGICIGIDIGTSMRYSYSLMFVCRDELSRYLNV